MINFDKFIDLYTGLTTDFDNAYGTQCMDLMHFYVYLCLDIYDKSVLSAPTAAMAFNKDYPQYFKKIKNGPLNYPVKGDIVFWGTKAGPAGHVAICVEATPMKLKTFDANWPVGTKPHIQDHKYSEGVIGWFHPLKEAVDYKNEYEKLLIEHKVEKGIVKKFIESMKSVRDIANKSLE